MKKILIVFICILLFTGCSKNNKAMELKVDKSDINFYTSSNIVGDREVSGMSFTKTKIYTNNGTFIETTITNNSNSSVYVSSIDVIFKDKSNDTIEVLKGYVEKTLSSGEEFEINITSPLVYGNLKYVEYSINN